MYSYKEKIKHYSDLSAPDHVLIDLEHLRKIDPRNEHLPSFQNAPERSAGKILYALLDLVSAEEIRNYRRQAILDRGATQEEAARLEEEKNAREEVERLAKVEAERLAAEKELLAEQLDETELERDEAIEEKEDLEEKLADTKTELEEVRAELEEEKKSEVKPAVKTPANPASSKKKTSTPKSTGKTSSTKTSK